MERSFIAVMAIASTLMFAGVWKATEPTSIPAPAVADTKALPDTAVAAPALRRHVVTPARVVDAEPYNVVRPALGSSPPARRSTSSGTESSVFYSGCREVRAAGAAPLYRGQPGYRAGMDGDGDGIACEPYR